MARWTAAIISVSLLLPYSGLPISQQPNPMAETLRPVLPSLRCCTRYSGVRLGRRCPRQRTLLATRMTATRVDDLSVELILDAHAQVGEGPVWDDASGTLVWVDI